MKELAELGSNYQQTMDKLPDVDELGGQVVGRGRLMREASLQRYLNEAINALRRFMPNRAELVLNKITDITSHHPDLGTDYHIEIEFVVQEYQIQNQRPEKMLAYLASLREGLESKSLPLQGETIKRLENLWQQTTSVFVGELWNLAQPKQKRVEARLLETERYERLQIEVHKELLALLKEQKVDDLQPRLDQFDQIWRGELGKNSSLRLQLDGFVNTWNERITQAQNLGDEIHDLKMLINSAYDRYQGRVKALNFGGEMFDRMETVIVYTLPEVSFVFSKEYHYLLRRLAAGLEVGKMGLSDEQVENVFQDRNIGDWPIWKRIEKQATRGRRFFAILEEETAPYGG